MNSRLIKLVLLAGMVLGALAALRPASAPENKAPIRPSQTYTIVVSLQAASPFVPDGRMSIADLAFSATFKDVVLIFGTSLPESYDFVEQHEGELFLTRHEFNDVEGGCERHAPWVKKPWPMKFRASLIPSWIEKDEEDADAERDLDELVPLVPERIKFGFCAHFGLLDLEWFSKLGSCVLSSMKYDFEVPREPLLEGKPVSLKLPYEEGDPEDKGMWWIEFIPKTK